MAIKVEGMAEVASWDTDTLRDLTINMHSRMWEQMRLDRLLHAKPEKLDALVYEEIERETIWWESEQPLEKHIASLRKIAAKAPQGCEVVIEFERDSDYEGGYDTVRRIGFYRKPTPEEIEERKALNAEIRQVQAAAAEKAAEHERAEFERLKTKYGG